MKKIEKQNCLVGWRGDLRDDQTEKTGLAGHWLRKNTLCTNSWMPLDADVRGQPFLKEKKAPAHP